MKDTVDIVTNIMSLPFADVYDVSAEIGRGKFAVVKRCKHKTSGMEYAAKYLKKRRKGKDCKKEVLHEVHMLELAITHPHIIRLVEVYETNLDLIIITDFAKGGELFEHITAEGQLKESVTIRLLRQILDGLSFLHANNIAHLDVKPQNILLTDALPHGDIKLCDFGLARLFNCGHDILEIIGTPDYVAPEVLDYKPLGSSCDMWSIGVLTYVMLTGFSPFAGDSTQETYLNISQVNLDFPDDLFEHISKEALNFMRSVLIKDPVDRLTARQSLNHAWLQTSDQPNLPVIAVGSPSGQRRSVEATKDPDFHKPIKKSRCDTNSDDEVQLRLNAETNPNEQEKENLITVPETSNSTSKLLSTSFDATQLVSASFDIAKPVSTSFDIAKPVSTSFDIAKPVSTSFDIAKPVSTSFDIAKPVSTSFDIAKPVSTSFDIAKPVSTSYDIAKPVSTSFDIAKPVSTSFDIAKPVSTSFDVSKPVSTSFDVSKPVSTNFSTNAAVLSLSKFKFSSLELPTTSDSSDLNRNDLHVNGLKCCDECHRKVTHVSSVTWSRDNLEMDHRELAEIRV